VDKQTVLEATEAMRGLFSATPLQLNEHLSARYGAETEPACGETDAPRDAWELALIAAARAAGTPVLGICRGIQILNVAFGGTLVQENQAAEGPTHHIAADITVMMDDPAEKKKAAAE